MVGRPHEWTGRDEEGIQPGGRETDYGACQGLQGACVKEDGGQKGLGLDHGSEPHPAGWGRSSRGLIQARRISLSTQSSP